jgi:hypothetical protein
MLKKIGMLVAVFLLVATPTVYSDGLEGAWSLEGYEFDNKDVPVSGVMIFADGHFAVVYKMDYEGRSGRGHGGNYSLEGDEITYMIPWWVEHVAGKSQVMKDEVEAKGRVEVLGDLLVIRFASGSVQKLKKLTSGDAGDLAGAWLMDSYESRAKTGPTSGMMMFAGDSFTLTYTMKPEGGKDGKAHAGTYERDGGAMTLSVAWSMQVVEGEGSVDEGSSSRKTKVTVAGDSLTVDLGGGAVQKFHRAGTGGASR